MTANNAPRPHLGYKRAHTDPLPMRARAHRPKGNPAPPVPPTPPHDEEFCTPTKPARASEIDCRSLTEPLMATEPIMDGPALTWRWDGYRNESECIEITRYMSRIGCVWTHVAGAKTCHYYHATLWLNVTMHDTGKVFVVLRDYNQMDPQPVSRMLVIDGGAR